jgi:hypothetical protein
MYSKDWAISLLLFTFGVLFFVYLLIDFFITWSILIKYVCGCDIDALRKLDEIISPVFCAVLGVEWFVIMYRSDYPTILKILLFCLVGPGIVYLPRFIYLKWTRSL